MNNDIGVPEEEYEIYEVQAESERMESLMADAPDLEEYEEEIDDEELDLE